jgi:hypothetical protein
MMTISQFNSKCATFETRRLMHLKIRGSQHFIFSLTYKWALQARVFVPGKPFQPIYFNTLAYLEKKVKFCEPLHLSTLIFMLTHKWAQ